MASDLALDLEELKHLQGLAKRPRVQSLISSEIRNLEQIYVSLEGVDEEKVEADFSPKSIDIKFHDVQGKNYRCAIPKLNKEIVPEKCKVVVKPKRVIITLFKASKGNWLDLHFKEDKLKPNLGKDGDPMAGIMNLMKNMYDEGDEDLKRTMTKAWFDARSGKPAGI
ncbi:Calcyclin-binding protein [Linum grandiflorum]